MCVEERAIAIHKNVESCPRARVHFEQVKAVSIGEEIDAVQADQAERGDDLLPSLADGRKLRVGA